MASSTRITALATHRSGWRTGTTVSSATGTASPPGPVAGGRPVRSSGMPPGAGTIGQLVAPLITDEVTAPDCTPHLVRIWV